MSDTNNLQEVLTLPLDGWHRAKGARMVPFAGYAMPIQYEGIMAEHLWTRESAGLFDVSHMGQLILSGDGADAALEAVTPSDLIGLKQGKQRYSMLLNEDGWIEDDMMVARAPMGLYLVVNGSEKAKDIAFLRAHLPDHLTLTHLEDRALLALQGPKAVDALARVVPGVDRLFFMEADSFIWANAGDPQPLWISRSGYTGEDGFEISVPADHAVALADVLAAQPEVKPIGLGARDSLRLEAGLPLYGHDLNDTTNPAMADLGFAVAKRRREAADFPGAASILIELNQGPPLTRLGFIVEGRQPVRENVELFDGDRSVGFVTSGGHSPCLGQPIGMALLEENWAKTGLTLEAEVRGKRVPVKTVPMPFVPHRYHRAISRQAKPDGSDIAPHQTKGAK
ncbi:MAG: glycine cleavage system aminomethyltransferase GcvT [Sphingomonadales bacterium]|nr:glycine cleavage system aminomethyltransferase GcvT [Sphingomonadales bacterium]